MKKYDNLKQIKDLQEGELKVIAKNGLDCIKEFEGSFSSELNCVFFAIPSNYKILGYIQD